MNKVRSGDKRSINESDSEPGPMYIHYKLYILWGLNYGNKDVLAGNTELQ